MNTAPEATASDNVLTAGFAPAESAAPAQVEGQAQQQESTEWYSGYSDDFKSLLQKKGMAKLSQPEAVESLAKSYMSLESLRGVPADQLYTIKPDMSDEDRAKVYRALGAPEDVQGYTYQARETDSPELVDAFKGAAHKLGLTDKQMSGLLNEMNPLIESMAGQQQQAIHQKNVQGLEALQGEWAGAWEQKVNTATRAAEYFGINQDIQQAIVNSGHSAEFLKALNKIGSLMAEGQMVGMSPTDQRANIGAMTKSEAQETISKLQGDPDFRARLQSTDRKIAEQASKELEKYYRILSGS